MAAPDALQQRQFGQRSISPDDVRAESTRVLRDRAALLEKPGEIVRSPSRLPRP